MYGSLFLVVARYAGVDCPLRLFDSIEEVQRMMDGVTEESVYEMARKSSWCDNDQLYCVAVIKFVDGIPQGEIDGWAPEDMR